MQPRLNALMMQGLSGDRQLFRFQPIEGITDQIHIVHKESGLALDLDNDGWLVLATLDCLVPTQQWAIGADDQLLNAAWPGAALTLTWSDVDWTLTGYRMTPMAAGERLQQFCRLYPADFVYLRNSWTGKVLTAYSAGLAVLWESMDPAKAGSQLWGITSDGKLVCPQTSAVLGLSSVTAPAAGLELQVTAEAYLATGDSSMRFDLANPDGTIKTWGNYVIGMDGNRAVTEIYYARDDTQLIEPLSPFQFFSLKNGCITGDGYQAWLVRQGDSCTYSWTQPTDYAGLFTVSRYGEIISPLDGHVLQSRGPSAAPVFVDPEPDPIGFDTTTFQYVAGAGGYGAIMLRGSDLGLISVGVRPTELIWMEPIYPPTMGNQAWQLVWPANSLVSPYLEVARAFFADPAPLPGEPARRAALADAEVAAFAGDLSRTEKVAFTLVTGILDLAGISVGTLARGAGGAVARIVLGNIEVAAAVLVVMRGPITGDSIIAVARSITIEGLWTKIFKEIMPHSFWGWALTIAKVSITILAWSMGGGAAITGAKIAILCIDIRNILDSDPDAVRREVDLLSDHVERCLTNAQPTIDAANVAPAMTAETG